MVTKPIGLIFRFVVLYRYSRLLKALIVNCLLSPSQIQTAP